MAEVDVEPVFKTPRQRLVRDVLTAVVACAVFWLFLGATPGLLGALLLVGGCVVAPVFVIARARGIVPRWPNRGGWNLVVDAAIVLGTYLLLTSAPNEVAWTGIGFAVGGLAARLALYATGEWRPGDPS